MHTRRNTSSPNDVVFSHFLPDIKYRILFHAIRQKKKRVRKRKKHVLPLSISALFRFVKFSDQSINFKPNSPSIGSRIPHFVLVNYFC
ncbi:unnamed protein product [Lathyrus oleraceus]